MLHKQREKSVFGLDACIKKWRKRKCRNGFSTKNSYLVKQQDVDLVNAFE